MSIEPTVGLPSHISVAEFDEVASLVFSQAGIVLGPEKRSMVMARLLKRLKARSITSVEEYLKLLKAGRDTKELAAFTSAMTTNYTSFFREPHHFDALAECLTNEYSPQNHVKIWSAGCSSGQEPVSIALTWLELPVELRPRISITATDIDESILTRARCGVYREAELGGLSDCMSRKYLQRDGEQIRVEKSVSELISYRQLNLHENWPDMPVVDIIFCRNVAIYFDHEHQERLWRRFHDALSPGGLLFIGHSERIPPSLHSRLKPSGLTMYRKPRSVQ